MNVPPKKMLGQHFLVDKNLNKKVSARMEEFTLKNPNLPILEIGPGQGDLTKNFVNWGRQIYALEVDNRAVEFLQQNLIYPNLEFIEIDVLKLFESLSKGQEEELIASRNLENFILLANLPYNVGSRILVDLAAWKPEVPFCVILQKEVVKKVTNRDYLSFFGAWLNLFWDIKCEFSIPPNAFYPKPRVYSSLMTGKPKPLSSHLSSVADRIRAMQTLKKLFSNPSKTLGNNLKFLDWDKNRIENFFVVHDMDIKTRLTWSNYASILAKVLS